MAEQESALPLLLLGAWALVINIFAWVQGLYIIKRTDLVPKVSGWTVFGGFSIYLTTAFAIPGLLYRIIPSLTTIQLISSLIVLFSLALFSWQIDKRIWKASYFSPVSNDCFIGALFWLLSFPLATLIGSTSDWILLHLFQIEPQEQVAIYYLKWAKSSPFALSVALFSILVSAPIAEEILFRGILQRWLRQFLGYKKAIFLSACAFSLFHFSRDQGLSNISILLSLLTLGYFLGLLYEKQNSLIAPITLHIIFNAVSVWRILT